MRTRITPSLVVSLIALFIALGGVAHATVDLPWNSVGKEQLKWSAVDSSKVENRSLKAVDFAQGELPVGRRGARGEKGARGATGAPGATGAKGDPGASSAGAAGLVVTDANGVVAGTLVNTGGNSALDVKVLTTNGTLVEYISAGGDQLVLKPWGLWVSLNPDCSPPLYELKQSLTPRNAASTPFYGGTVTYFLPRDAPTISPSPSSTVYQLVDATDCRATRADTWRSTPEFVRADLIAPGVVPTSLTLPLSFGG
jgi:hypothetical protein